MGEQSPCAFPKIKNHVSEFEKRKLRICSRYEGNAEVLCGHGQRGGNALLSAAHSGAANPIPAAIHQYCAR